MELDQIWHCACILWAWRIVNELHNPHYQLYSSILSEMRQRAEIQRIDTIVAAPPATPLPTTEPLLGGVKPFAIPHRPRAYARLV